MMQRTRSHRSSHYTLFPILISIVLTSLCWSVRTSAADTAQDDAVNYTIYLKSRTFVPSAGLDGATRASLETRRATTETPHLHTLLQLHRIPTDAETQALQQQGIQLLDYIPDNGWLAVVPGDRLTTVAAHPLVRWVGDYTVADKLTGRLRNGIPNYALNPDGSAKLYVKVFADASLAEAAQLVTTYGGRVVATVVPMHGLKIALPPAQLDALAREDIVQRVSALGQPRTVNNDGIRSKVGVQHLGASTALPELDGTGVMVAQWDEFWVSLRHMGFWETFFGPPRVIWPGECFDPTGDVCTSQHATHVAGTILSNELVAPGRYRGMAPNAHMISFQWWVGPSSFLWGHDKAILENNADISANSWGLDPVAVGEVGDYLEPSAWIDAAVRGGIFYNKPLLTSWSAGNSRDPRIPSSFFCDDAVRLYGCINEPGATAKNVITVGATDSNYEGRPVAFSSVGPTDDGRLKPDVMAPGTEDRPWLPVFDELLITSAEHPDSYWQTLGTSMAQPVVAGSAALLIQQYRDKHVANPLPSTIKALLIHTARDIGRHGPDYEYGYGRINTEMASQLITQNLVREGNIIVQDNVIHKITVPDNAEELRVTLVWSDFPAAPSLAKDLMNDLDLILMKPAPLEIHEPWVLDPTDPEALATRGVNRRDNVEQVVVDRPRSGEWVINVSAFRVPMRPQNYSLVISGKIAHSHRHIYDVIAIKESEEFEPDIDGRIVRFRAFGGGVQVGSSGSRYDVSTDCASHTEIMVKDTFGGTTLACLDSGEVYAVPDVTKSYHLAGAAIQPRDPSRDAPDGYPNVIAVMKAEQPKFQGIILGGGGVGLPGPNCPGGGPGGRCP